MYRRNAGSGSCAREATHGWRHAAARPVPCETSKSQRRVGRRDRTKPALTGSADVAERTAYPLLAAEAAEPQSGWETGTTAVGSPWACGWGNVPTRGFRWKARWPAASWSTPGTASRVGEGTSDWSGRSCGVDRHQNVRRSSVATRGITDLKSEATLKDEEVEPRWASRDEDARLRPLRRYLVLRGTLALSDRFPTTLRDRSHRVRGDPTSRTDEMLFGFPPKPLPSVPGSSRERRRTGPLSVSSPHHAPCVIGRAREADA